MTASLKSSPLRSRLGRQIYVLAALLASLPLILVGVYSLFEIDSAHRAQAQQALDQSLRSFGELMYERFLQSSELGRRMISERLDVQELPPSYLNYAVLDAGDVVHSTFPDSTLPPIEVRGTADRPQIDIADAPMDPAVYLSLRIEATTFVGQLDPVRLWSDRAQYPFATEFCIATRSRPTPVFCSSALPSEQFRELLNDDATRGTLSWETNDKTWHTAYWDLFLPSAFEADPLRIVGSQPDGVAYGAAAAFRQIYVPGLLLTLVITLIGAGWHARRFLTPLATLLAVTRRFANRDFSARAELGRNDEFQDLATGLTGMAQALDRQFRQREALSRLDYLILSGDGIEDVLRTAVAEALSYLPFASIELDVQVASGDHWFRYAQVRGEDGLSKSIVDNSDTGRLGKGTAMECRAANIVVSEARRGVVRGYFERQLGVDRLSEEQLGELADRVAMALEFHEQSAELNRRAWFDELTGLPNRESCLLKIDRAIETAEYNGHMVALLYIDLDGFKSVNDSLGHEAGDELIRLAAERIMRCLGHQGVTARLGGDEFAVIVPYSAGHADDYKIIGKQILTVLQAPFKIGNSEAYLGASIGTARYPEDGISHSELLRKADAAMYRAKDSGRGRQVDYSRTLGIVIAKRLRLEADLNRALERNEMSLVYQPQVDLSTGAMCSAEALLRWNHATEGFISPDEFIPVAEETNQILTLGNWVLFNACAQFSEWLERGIPLKRIAVNVSANQLRHDEFLHEVKDCIDRFSLETGMLELELTERVFVDSRELSAAIHSLKKMGVVISIDDFGTGYSSLGSLKNLEFDMVKIDRSFIGSLPHDRQSVSIIQAVLAMCRTLEKAVVAEGVETSQQLQYLAETGVEFAQGYYFSKPVPAQEFERIIRAAENATDNTIQRIVNFERR